MTYCCYDEPTSNVYVGSRCPKQISTGLYSLTTRHVIREASKNIGKCKPIDHAGRQQYVQHWLHCERMQYITVDITLHDIYRVAHWRALRSTINQTVLAAISLYHCSEGWSYIRGSQWTEVIYTRSSYTYNDMLWNCCHKAEGTFHTV